MTTTLTSNFNIPIPPLGVLGDADGYDTLMQAADTAIANASGIGAWTDYSGTSTIVGWSSFVSKVLKYKKVGNTILLTFFLNGTSDNTATTFTLPFASVAPIENLTLVQDNGGALAVGMLSVAPSGSTVTFYSDLTV